MPGLTSNGLRCDLSQRNGARARVHDHELSYGAVPSVIYKEQEGGHGNFIAASYRAICRDPEWRRRLDKTYTGSQWVPRSRERKRRELDCANSSDALLMNVFCYPGVLRRAATCALLGVEPRLRPEFGWRARVPLLNGRGDRTEVDMRLGGLLIEAKLTEGGFQPAAERLVLRYRDFDEVFNHDELRTSDGEFRGYQLIRGVLAAFAAECSFMLLCDERRRDLIDGWFDVVKTVRSYSFRNRLKLLTWQEVAGMVPGRLQKFLAEKYGITRNGRRCGVEEDL
ncbi:MAG: hypothetical protein JOZ83_15100 [Silvibacterium sp.]|nr:hypothetical protein [Silvibacterium sp.]